MVVNAQRGLDLCSEPLDRIERDLDVAFDVELRVVNGSDLARSIDHVGLTPAKKAKHVRFDVDLLADGVILIHNKPQFITPSLDRIASQRERIGSYADDTDASI